MSLVVNGLQRRADIVVFRAAKPFVVVECKAPSVPLSQAVVDQAVDYHRVLQVRYVVLTNGPEVRYIRIGTDDNSWALVDALPPAEI